MIDGKIGEYIHHRAINYINYGIRRKSKSSGGWDGDLTDVYRDQMWRLNAQKAYLYKAGEKRATKKDVEMLEKLINDYMHSFDSTYNYVPTAEFSKMIDANLMQQIPNAINRLLSVPSGASLDYLAGGLNGIDYFFGLIKTDKIKKGNAYNIKYLISVRDRLVKLIQFNTKNGIAPFSSTQITYVRNEIINLNKIIDNSGGHHAFTDNIIQQLNALIEISELYQNWSKIKGDFFEYLLSAFNLCLKQNVDNGITSAIDEAVKKGVVGKKQEPVRLNKERFIKKFSGEYSDIFTEERYSPQKVDVVINFNGKKLRTSAKNINIGNSVKQISVVSGSSLAFLLQNQYPPFVNHYLSLYSYARRGEHVRSFLDTKREEFYNYLLITLAVVGLTGINDGRTPANFFIINDSGSGRVRCLTMESIIDHLINMTTMFNRGNFGNGVIASKPIITKLYKNKWVSAKGTRGALEKRKEATGKEVNMLTNKAPSYPAAMLRISNILNQLHQRKIKVTINSNLLKYIK